MKSQQRSLIYNEIRKKFIYNLKDESGQMHSDFPGLVSI